MIAQGRSVRAFSADADDARSCHAALRDATHAAHERLHRHAGFAGVADGTIDLVAYRALLGRLYGFYRHFERAIGAEPIRTGWLERDLAWWGDDIAQIPLCTGIPCYDAAPQRLGARYMVEGSALGGRVLVRGLDRLCATDTVDGRRFFTGHGAATGAQWRGFVDHLETAGADPDDRAAMIGAAVETFARFEIWLDGWDSTS